MEASLRVATINLLNDQLRWLERRSLLAEGLARADCDLIALQEVTEPLADSTAHWLARELGGYAVQVAPKTGWSRRREGIATLNRLPVERHEILDLLSQGRVAQWTRVEIAGRPVVFGKGHYHWHPFRQQPRWKQVARVLDQLNQFDPESVVVVVGDFNGLPDSPAIELIRRTLVSAYARVHGREPEFTCATPLRSRDRLRGPITRALLRLGTNRPGESWRGTLDYIFISPTIEVVNATVFLDQPSPDDPTLYASDHLGLVADLIINPVARA